MVKGTYEEKTVNLHQKKEQRKTINLYHINKEISGITLIALVVTIIVLLILAGITINLVLNDGGIFAKAQQAKIEQRKAELLDQLNTAKATVQVQKLGKPTLQDYITQIYQEQIIVDDAEQEDGSYQVTTEDGYVFNISIIEGKNVNNIVIEYEGQEGNLPPVIKLVNTTTNSIEVKVVRAEGATKYKYEYKEVGAESYTTKEENSTSDTCIFTGLKSNQIYSIRVEVTIGGEVKVIEKPLAVGKIPTGGVIKLKSITWTDGVATAIIYHEETGNYQIEWQKNGSEEASWTRENVGEKEITISNLSYGDTLYVRLYDGYSSGDDGTINLNDDILPQEATITPSKTEAAIGETITAEVTQKDNESGIEITSCKWVYTTQSTLLGTDNTEWETAERFTTTPETINLTSSTSGSHYLHVLSVDMAGNKKESISEAIAEKTNTPTGWIQVEKTDSRWYDYGTEVNEPVLGTGMTPIIYASEDGTTTKRWANAMTADGSMWVWIPRYAYQITSNYQKGGSGVSGNINIKFLNGTGNTPIDGSSITIANASGQNNWNVHPAFTYGNAVKGIWVAKFEASFVGTGTTAASGEYDGIDKTLQVKPGVASWRSITIGNIYTVCKNYNTTLNSHQMKNSEWGAVAYLAQSTYGKNSEVWINPNSNYITGQAGTGPSVSSTTSTYAYTDTTYGVNASTTGNVYGIYDMSGGAFECVAAYVNNNYVKSGNNQYTYGKSLIDSTDSKTKDVYNTGSTDNDDKNYIAAASVYGNAVYETSSSYSESNSWYGDYSNFPYSYGPFFLRGGGYDATSNAGLFYFYYGNGSSGSHDGFRPVLVAL